MPRIFALVVLTLLPSILEANECVLKPLKPVKVGGSICGTVISIDNGERIDGTEVVLRDAAGVLVATTVADSSAAFRFPAVPTGRYQIDVPGFSFYMKEVELTSSRRGMCAQPVVVYAGLTYCSGGYVGRTWDYRRFPDGPPALRRDDK